jgi:hypothetical protein
VAVAVFLLTAFALVATNWHATPKFDFGPMDDRVTDRQLATERVRIALLMCFHTFMCCVSLYCIATSLVVFDPAKFHIFYDPAQLPNATIAIAAFALTSVVFCFAPFSFGYIVGFYFYTMISGYLWLNCFTDLNYDHRLAGISAAVSAATFLFPALFIVLPVKQIFTMSAKAFDRLLLAILLLATAAVVIGSRYNFRLAGIGSIYDFRDAMETPVIVSYVIAIVGSALLPFVFAGFIFRKAYWRAVAALLLLLLFYPITLSKLALFAPFWLVGMLLLSRFFSIKTAIIMSLLVPVLTGLILFLLFKGQSALYFSIVNARLFAIPSSSLDVYNDFFSTHEPTYFCQISMLKRIMTCPYKEPLWAVMKKAYDLGNLNASLFATEGVASVGLLLAPVATFGCGLVIALGNRVSAGLPPRFVLLSSAVLLPILLNVPLSIVMNTHGAAILLLLWYITPRTIFEENATVAN